MRHTPYAMRLGVPTASSFSRLPLSSGLPMPPEP